MGDEIYLLRYEEEPSAGYGKMLQSEGFLTFRFNCEAMELASETGFETAFAGPDTYALNLQKDEYVKFAVAKEEAGSFRRALKLLKAAFEPLQDPIQGTGPAIYAFKLAAALVLPGNFIDRAEVRANLTGGCRAIWFNQNIQIHFRRHSDSAGNQFEENSKSFIELMKGLECGITVFDGKAYGSTCGDGAVMELAKHDILLLPVPCSFHPLTSGKNVYMGTALFQPSLQSGTDVGHGLGICRMT